MAGTVSLREKHTIETRERILEVAMQLFTEQGFDATTIDEIAQRADVSPRTFFRYFPSKEAVLFHEMECGFHDLQGLLSERPESESPAESLVAVLAEMIGRLDASPERRALMVSLHNERQSLRQYQRTAIVERMEQEVAAVLADRAGTAPDDIGLRSMMAAVLGCFDLALRIWIERDLEAPFAEVFHEVLAGCGRWFPVS